MKPDFAKRDFASDNNAGVHPEVLEVIGAANQGHVRAYGDDPYTERARELVGSAFGQGTEVHFVFSGTGGNVLGLKAVTQPHEAIVCADSAHIHRDECGAPERFTGCKLLTVRTPNGKLSPADIAPFLADRGSEHHAQPRVVSITQPTELGTLYQPSEVRALADFCHAHELVLHMDGARLFNAAAALGGSLASSTSEAGVDVLTLGGTKNGLLFGEAVLFLNGRRSPDFKYLRKQGMQLASKMRFLAAQFTALFSDGLWRRNAEHANAMAQALARGLGSVRGVRMAHPVEANAVFAYLPASSVRVLQAQAYFYTWGQSDVAGTELVRLMTSFDTKREDVDTFVSAAKQVLLHSAD